MMRESLTCGELRDRVKTMVGLNQAQLSRLCVGFELKLRLKARRKGGEQGRWAEENQWRRKAGMAALNLFQVERLPQVKDRVYGAFSPFFCLFVTSKNVLQELRLESQVKNMVIELKHFSQMSYKVIQYQRASCRTWREKVQVEFKKKSQTKKLSRGKHSYIVFFEL